MVSSDKIMTIYVAFQLPKVEEPQWKRKPKKMSTLVVICRLQLVPVHPRNVQSGRLSYFTYEL